MLSDGNTRNLLANLQAIAQDLEAMRLLVEPSQLNDEIKISLYNAEFAAKVCANRVEEHLSGATAEARPQIIPGDTPKKKHLPRDFFRKWATRGDEPKGAA